jgi:histidinol-phosphate aminotransferase
MTSDRPGVTGARPIVRDLVRTAQPKRGRIGLLRLDLNERVVGFPDGVIAEVLRQLPGDFVTAYPETKRFYARLAEHHGLSPDEVLICAGSELAIRYIFEAYLDRGDTVVLLDPSFAMFEVYARLCGARIVAVPYDRTLNISLAHILDAIDARTKVVAIANPNNPTGSVLPQQSVVQVIEKAAAVGAICLIDEAYYYFHSETVAPLVSQYPHLVVTRTFSKACGLASVRLGYALGSRAVIAEAQKLQPIDHASGFAVALGTYMVDHEEIAWAYAANVRDGRAMVASELTSLGFPVVDSAANFLVFDVGEDPRRIADYLRERGILISTNLRLPFPHQFVRVTVGPPESMRPFVDAMRAYARQSGGRASLTT